MYSRHSAESGQYNTAIADVIMTHLKFSVSLIFQVLGIFSSSILYILGTITTTYETVGIGAVLFNNRSIEEYLNDSLLEAN